MKKIILALELAALCCLGANAAATLTFAADGNFTLTAGKLNIPGSWTKDGTSIEITFTKLFSLKMKGKVTRTSEGCSVLFESEKFVTFAKNVLDVA